MTVKIKKLTPPQITALRDTFPSAVIAGVLTTTGSIATFNDKSFLPASWRADNVRRLLTHEVSSNGGCPIDRRKPMQAVLDKLEHRPDLVEES